MEAEKYGPGVVQRLPLGYCQRTFFALHRKIKKGKI